jgi:hypothetical protein
LAPRDLGHGGGGSKLENSRVAVRCTLRITPRPVMNQSSWIMLAARCRAAQPHVTVLNKRPPAGRPAGHLAGGFFASGIILLLFIVELEKGCNRERSNECRSCAGRCCCCLCAPAENPLSVHVSLALLLAATEAAGAAAKGHSRVRHFAGLVAFPVVKRRRVRELQWRAERRKKIWGAPPGPGPGGRARAPHALVDGSLCSSRHSVDRGVGAVSVCHA